MTRRMQWDAALVLTVAGLCFAHAHAILHVDCPSYSDIRTESTYGFNAELYQGRWFQIAHRDNGQPPPSLCRCPILDWQLKKGGAYFVDSYSCTYDLFGKVGVEKVDLQGYTTDVAGLMHEGFNTKSAIPNMIVWVDKRAQPWGGVAYDRAIVYSCGRLFGFPFDALQFLSRSQTITETQYEEMVEITESKGIKVEGITQDIFEDCLNIDAFAAA